MVGEHFGMAVVEAMVAGLIPVVPNEGGPAEFIPQEYQFNTIEQAAEIITYIFNYLPKTERIKISDDTINKFSTSHYIERFQTILNDLLSQGTLHF
jgi:glycosyltransferase involved in cell wall biosynthesis